MSQHKKAIDVNAATVPKREHLLAIAMKQGFSRQDAISLWRIAIYPDSLDDEKRKQVCKIIDADPKKAAKVINEIRRRNEQRKRADYRNVILESTDDIPNWMLPDTKIAQLVRKRKKINGQLISQNMVATVKQVRRELYKEFPLRRLVVKAIRPLGSGSKPSAQG